LLLFFGEPGRGSGEVRDDEEGAESDSDLDYLAMSYPIKGLK